MKENISIKKNFIYNIIYQILLLLLPLITVPYVSRILGAEGIGIFSYTYSIVNYFILIAMLGINNYGNRTIAKIRENKSELSKTFYSIYYIQVFMSVLMIIIYSLYIFLFDIKYKLVMIIQGINLIAVMLDINWFFFGLEKFKLTITRSLIIKVISLIGIFLFIKNRNDVYVYVMIIGMSTLISNLFLISFLKKEISHCIIKFSDIKKHIKPVLILFIPVVAVSLYKIMDKIMLGILSDISEVGYYEQGEKIINIPMGIVTALGTVMLPRISNLVAKGDNKAIEKYIYKSINFMMFLAFPICFGLITISKDFIYLFLGNEFSKTSSIIYYLSITIIFISFANVIRTQYLIPKERDKIYVSSVIGGAIINIIINYLLIPKYKSIGACIGTIVAEFFVMFYQIHSVKRELPIKKYIKENSIFLVKSLIMFAIIIPIKMLSINVYLKLILQITSGITIYLILNIKYINSLADFNKVFNKIKRKNYINC